MFTMQQIEGLHARFGSAKTLVDYVRALKALGVEHYDSYLADGHSEYFGKDGYTLISRSVHEVLVVADVAQREAFLEHLRRHELGQSNYLEMSKGLAQSGVEKWTVDTAGMTMTFSDKTGRSMLVNEIS